MRHNFVLLSIALATPAPAPALAQFGLQDGGFDTQGAGLSPYCYLPDCPAGAWTGTGGFIQSGAPIWGGLTAPSLPAMAFVQGDGQLSQTFTATASRRVRLAWLEADRPFWGGETYIVSVNGVSVGSFTSYSTVFQQRLSSPFDITMGGSFTITFAGQSPGVDRSSLIDSVRLVADEPSTTNYTYDALGRLTGVTTTGGINNGVNTAYSLDKAGNRTNVTVTGAQP